MASKEVQKGGGQDGEPQEPVGSLAGDAKEGTGNGKWQSLADRSNSPKGRGPLTGSAVIVGQSSETSPQPSPKISDIGAPSWQTSCNTSTKKPLHEGLNAMLSSFDFFSNEEYPDGDKKAISIAFGK